MKPRTMIAMLLVSVMLIITAFPVSAETAGDLQREEREIIVTDSYSQTSELTTLRNEIILKRNEIQTFKKNILSCIQWNTPPDIMTLSANGRLEGDFFLISGDIEGEFSAQASAKSGELYKGFDPYISEEATKEMLLFARNLLEENETYSPAEQVLEIQLKELENKEINESGGMHIFYIQKLYNSVVDIENELDASIVSIGNKMQTEQTYEDRRNFDKLSIFGKIIHLWKLWVVLLAVIIVVIMVWMMLSC